MVVYIEIMETAPQVHAHLLHAPGPTSVVRSLVLEGP